MKLKRWGLTFTYYPQSGGVIVERNGIPLDAGIIRIPGAELSWDELRDWADEWFARDDMTTKRANSIKLRKSRRNP